ncbi:MAG: Tol-Pal system beta propeller repeat protein TolB [Acidobacteriota bacterium]
MTRMTIKFLLILVIFLIPISLMAQQEIVIKIKEGLPLIPVGIPDFAINTNNPSLKEAADLIYKTVWNDLKFSIVFQPISREMYAYTRPVRSSKIFFKDWESIQANILITGEISSAVEDRVIFSVKVWDVKSEGFIFGRNYEGKIKYAREIAHKFSDQMMINFGEKPIFNSKIVFVSERDGNKEIYIMDWDGANQTRLTYNKVIDILPRIFSDRIRIAYTSYRKGNPDLYIFNMNEGKNELLFSKGINYAADFSPDGKKIAFVSSMEGNTEIYIANSDGTGLKRLTFNNSIDTSPSWSPNGREIAFTSDRSGSPQIYIMDVEGTNVRRITYEGSYYDSPAWSPDGDRIAFVSRIENNFDIYVYSIRNNTIIKLTEFSGRNENPSWSPDGRHLTFSSNRTGSYQIFLVDYDGQNVKQITFEGNNKMGYWSK